MSLLGVKSSSNILIKKRIWSGKEKNTAENQGVTHSRQRASSLYFYYQAFRPVKHMHYALVYEIQVIGKSKMSKEGEGHTIWWQEIM